MSFHSIYKQKFLFEISVCCFKTFLQPIFYDPVIKDIMLITATAAQISVITYKQTAPLIFFSCMVYIPYPAVFIATINDTIITSHVPLNIPHLYSLYVIPECLILNFVSTFISYSLNCFFQL